MAVTIDSIRLLYGLAALAIVLTFMPTKAKGKSPPGPKGLPILGNMFQIPKQMPWHYFMELSREYGPISKISVAGNDMVILDSPEDAEELLGRRSRFYSSRKAFPFAGKHLSKNKRLVIQPYGPLLKTQRQAFHQMLQPRVVGSYESMQLEETSKLLFDMLKESHDPFLNIRRWATGLLCMLTYGTHPNPGDGDVKQLIKITNEFLDDFEPGKHLADDFPILDHWLIPNFIARWRNEAQRRHVSEIAFYKRLLNDVKAKMNAGIKVESFATRLWEQEEKNGMDEECMAYVAGSAFEAGAGNVGGTIEFFLLAAVLHPDKFKAMQAELDSVLGFNHDGPPTFEHINRLPYSIAFCKEVLRWIPAAPISFPHYSTKDDEYKGFTIPAGTTIVPNVWSMHRNEKLYPQADKFIPERWMRKDEASYKEHDSLIDGHWAFGWGRRVCPGQHMASKSVWIAMAQLAWAFDIGYAFDKNGNKLPVDETNLVPQLTLEPKPFPMTITPRSAKHETEIIRLWDETRVRLGN